MIEDADTGEVVRIYEGLEDFSFHKYDTADVVSGGTPSTFYLLTEDNNILNTENDDKIRTEQGGIETFFILTESNNRLDTENNFNLRTE